MVGGTPSSHVPPHHSDLGWGTPPPTHRPGMGYPPPIIQTWDGVPPHHPYLGWGTPPPQTWDGEPPTIQTLDGVPPHPPTDLGQGIPPPKVEQIHTCENITSRRFGKLNEVLT